MIKVIGPGTSPSPEDRAALHAATKSDTSSQHETPVMVHFQCRLCGYNLEGKKEHTLWSEAAHVGEEQRFQIILERASRDLAGMTVEEDCKKCGRRYMTLVRFGKSATTYLVCKCGNQIKKT